MKLIKKDIKSMIYEELIDWAIKNGHKKFRAEQIFSWLHKQNVESFGQMKNISNQIIDQLQGEFYVNRIKIKKRLVSSMDNTVKYLYALEDGECVESVVMEYVFGKTVCISSQVGCKMGCGFCASGKSGFVRNLTASEMLDQFYVSQKNLDCNISNVVIMGIGEPLDNYDNFIRFFKNISHPKGRNLGFRHITISTCGLVDKIDMLADEMIPINLSISLHAPNDSIRKKIMPIAKKWSVNQLINICRKYAKKTNRRVTFEYACIDNLNTSPKHAVELSKLLKGMLCHVNLIPINPISERSFRPAKSEKLYKFSEILRGQGISVTIRRTLGQDINASCGQLRRNSLNV